MWIDGTNSLIPLFVQTGVNPVTVGSSADLEVGQKVYAIGNPFGLDHTLTTGVISGTGREIGSGVADRPLQVGEDMETQNGDTTHISATVALAQLLHLGLTCKF